MHCVIFVWFRAPLGGLHNNVRETVRSLLKARHSVTVVCRAGPLAKAMRREGCTVITTEFDNLQPVLDTLAMMPPTVVHVHPGPARVFGMTVADVFDVPVVATYHGKWLDHVQKYADDLDRILGVSPAICDAITRLAPWAKDRVMMVPNATHVGDFAQAPADPQAVPRAVVASRFDQDKRAVLALLAEAWQAQRDLGIALHWDIAGSGTSLDELKQAAQVLDGEPQSEVVFHGWLEETELNALYDQASFSVAPGRSAIDAMARGLLTVAVGSAGCFGLITAETFEEAAKSNFGGFGLTRNVSPKEFLPQIAQLAQDPAVLAAAQQAIHDKIAQGFDQDRWDRFLIDLYADLMKAHAEDQATAPQPA